MNPLICHPDALATELAREIQQNGWSVRARNVIEVFARAGWYRDPAIFHHPTRGEVAEVLIGCEHMPLALYETVSGSTEKPHRTYKCGSCGREEPILA